MKKKCTICKVSMLINEDNFNRDNHVKDGYKAKCRKCLTEEKRQYNLKRAKAKKDFYDLIF